MKNSKKGFTLVELVVVIAILAILAAIAIPVVSNTINSSKISGALSDAQTLELALKEADAQIVAGDKSIYTSSATLGSVLQEKGIKVSSSVTVKGSDYTLYWCKDDEKFYYVTTNAGGNRREITDDNTNFNKTTTAVSEGSTVKSFFD